jgi:hypothetical protein
LGAASGQPHGCRVLLSALRGLDGEKDPRNLLLFLQLLRSLCVRCAEAAAPGFDVAAAEVFDALALYFPISFTPPPNDPHRITEQHLLQALPPSLTSYALSSYPRRAPHCRRALSLPCL